MKKWILYVIIIILGLCLIACCFHKKSTEVIETYTTDTIMVVRIDTIIERIPTFIHETTVDTVYLENVRDSVIILPITQKYYSSDIYSAWVSGYMPNLDSIAIYDKVVTNTITNTITKEVYPKTTDFYIDAGMLVIKDVFTPNVGLSVKFKNNLVVGAKVGYYDKNAYYGVNLGFKLNND